MKKLLLSLFVTILSTIATFAITIGNINYELNNSRQTATVTGATSYDTINIPNTITYDGISYVVTSIKNSAFYNCSSLTSITIPNSVTSIGNYAFYNCSNIKTINIHADNLENYCKSNLNQQISTNNNISSTSAVRHLFVDGIEITELNIPENVTSISSYAFYNCDAITSISIPNSVTSIGDYAFNSCSSLTSISIPNSVTSIGNSAFSSCSSLTSISIPNSVTSIGNSAFSSCSSLTSISIPNSVTSIGEYAFYYCSRLTSITIPNSVTSIGKYAFSYCSSLTSIEIPNSVTSIEKYAFSYCSSLTSITIPDSVTSIGNDAFRDCSNIKTINIHADNLENYCKSNLNQQISTNNNISSTSAVRHLFVDGIEITELNIPENVTSISSYAFYNCDAITSISIPNSVTSIRNSAFSNCDDLTSITIPNSVTSIGDYAFSSCSSLTSISIPNSVTSIGDYAFSSCSSLTSISIPNSVTSIGNSAFSNCSNIKTINIHADNLENYCKSNLNQQISTNNNISSTSAVRHLFVDGIEITELNIPENVTSISSYAFYNCDAITSISIPNSVTSIGDYAFNSCSSLTSISIPNSVTSIGNSAFSNCSTINYITCESTNPENYSSSAFSNSNLKVVFVPKGTIDLYKEAWGNNYTYIDGELALNIHVPTPGGLASEIVKLGYMPVNVTKLTLTGELNDTDFAVMRVNMSKLYSIDLSGIDNTTIPSLAFESKKSLLEITLPNYLTSIGSSAFKDCSSLSKITIPNSTTSIGANAFENCYVLYEVDFGDGCNIGNYAFKNCSVLKEVKLNEGTTTIGTEAFASCSSLNKVTLPKTLTTINSCAFYICSALKEVHFNGEMSDWCDITFNIYSSSSGYENRNATSNPLYYAHNLYIKGLKVDNLEILGEIATLKSYVFAGCNFENVVLDNSIRTINSNAFYNCTNLKSVVIGNGVETIAENAFQYCSKLEKITLGNNVANMSYNTFNGCNGLDTIVCYGITPAVVATSGGQYKQFTSVKPDECLLIVPEEATVDYILAPVWGAYGNLQLHNNKYYTVKATSNDETMGRVTGGRSHVAGTIATLYAFANKGYNFKQWNDGNTDNPRSFTVTSDTTFVAEFEVNPNPTYAINVICNAQQGSTSGSGNYEYEEEVIISATATEDYHFVRWSDGVTTNPRTITVTADATYTAIFDINTFIINVSVNDTLRGIATGYGVYDKHTEVNISVTANYGYHFEKWNDENTDNPRTIVVTEDANYTAQLVPNKYIITAESSDANKGYIEGLGEYDYLTTATLTAKANHGYEFVSWNDGNKENPRNIEVTKDSAFTAEFQKTTFLVSLTVNDTEMGTVFGGGMFKYQSMTTLGAIANGGYKFVRWSDGSTFNPRALTVLDKVTLTAEFAVDGDAYYTVMVTPNNSKLGSTIGSGNYKVNTQVLLAAVPSSGAKFIGWSDGNTDNPRNIIVTENVEITAEFEAIDTYYRIKGESSDDAMGTVKGSGTYKALTEVILTAQPATGHYFVKWNDGETQNPRNITVYSDVELIAEFAANIYTITIGNSENGAIDGAGEYAYGSTITLSATPNEGYHFVKWSDESTENPRTITVTDNLTLDAIFEINVYNVSVIAENGVVDGVGEYVHGANATLSVTPNYGYEFVEWNNASIDNPRTLTITSDTTLTAIFSTKEYTISAVAIDNGMGNIEGVGTYKYMDNIALTAVANHGYKFVAWGDNNTENPRNIVVEKDTTYTALFEKAIFNLTVTSQNEDMGTVFGSGNFEYLTSTTVAAMPKVGYKFVSWSDGNTINPRKYTITDNIELVANFAVDGDAIYTIDLSCDISQGSVVGSGQYKGNTQITIAALPKNKYQFLRWSDNNTENPRNIIVTEDLTLRAIFIEKAPEKTYYHIEAYANNSKYGRVIGSNVYEENSNVDLFAQAYDGFYFINWSDGNTENPRTIIVTENATYEAIFGSLNTEFDIYAFTEDEDMGIVTGSGTYKIFAEATIEAIPYYGYQFVAWTDGNTENPRIIVITEDAEYEAIFKIINQDPSVDVESNNAETVVVYSQDGTLHIKGITEDYFILDSTGKLVYKGCEESIVLPKGVYFIKTSTETIKVVL